MKAYLITTALLFSLLAVLHIWRLIAEWPHATDHQGFVVGMVLLSIALGAFAWWGWWLLRKLVRARTAGSEAGDKSSR